MGSPYDAVAMAVPHRVPRHEGFRGRWPVVVVGGGELSFAFIIVTPRPPSNSNPTRGRHDQRLGERTALPPSPIAVGYYHIMSLSSYKLCTGIRITPSVNQTYANFTPFRWLRTRSDRPKHVTFASRRACVIVRA